MRMHRTLTIRRSKGDWLTERNTPGPDVITNEVIKKLHNTILKHIVEIFNSALKMKYFPCVEAGQDSHIPKTAERSYLSTEHRVP